MTLSPFFTASCRFSPSCSLFSTEAIEKHGLFQTYYYNHHYGQNRNLRDRYMGHPYYENTINFCQKWDQASFDPNYKTIPLEEFIPMLGRIFNREPYRFL